MSVGADVVVGYETGVRAWHLAATRSDRYLLTFLHGSHEVAAPIPAPAEAWANSDALKTFPSMHHEDGVWDSARSNNVRQHFATAFLSIHLKGETDKRAYLDVVPRGGDGVYSVARDGWPKPDYSYRKGFKPRTATGLVLEHLPAGEAPED